MIFYFIAAFLISIIIIPAFISFSKKKKFFDYPEGDELKIHKEPISILGGLAIFLAVAVVFLFLSFHDSRFLFIILSGFSIFLLGFWDDFKWKHINSRMPYFKFFFLIVFNLLSAGILYFADVGFYFFPLLPALYIFVMANAINYQDGMDGQAGILSLISLLGFFILGFFLGNAFVLQISLVFLGAVLGFLIFNFPPAKIFMGDSGAYLLGFSLALLSMLFSENVLAPLLILGMPLFDGIYTNLRRLVSGRSIFFGDREHFYDALLKKGFSAKKTLLISAVLQIAFASVGMLVFFL